MADASSIRALVPVKAFGLAKSRLGTVLDSDERACLSFWMLERVIGALGTVPAVSDVTIVAGDEATACEVAELGAEVIIQKGDEGLNDALEHALAQRTSSGAGFELIVAADLPLLSSEEVAELASRAAAGRVLIAPDRQGNGTNALLFPASTPLRLAFGLHSHAAHREAALSLGLEPVAVQSSGFAFDIDTPHDFDWLRTLTREGPWSAGKLPRFLRSENTAHA